MRIIVLNRKKYHALIVDIQLLGNNIMSGRAEVKTEKTRTTHLVISFYVSFVILIAVLFIDIKNTWVLLPISVVCIATCFKLFDIDYKVLQAITRYKP